MKGSTLSKDYSALEKSMAGDLNAAATSVSLSASGGTKKVRLSKSDLRRLIPDGAVVEVQAVNFTKLSMGDIICVSSGRDTLVRRFVKMKMTKQDAYLLTAYEGVTEKERVPKSQLIGKVISVQAQGRTYNPCKEENILLRLWGRVNEYGTHKVFGMWG